MVGKVGKSGGGAEDLLLIPDANIVGVGPSEKHKTSAEGLASSELRLRVRSGGRRSSAWVFRRSGTCRWDRPESACW